MQIIYVYFDLCSMFPGWELRTALILRDMGHRVMTVPWHRRPLMFSPETQNFDVIYVSNAVAAPLGVHLADIYRKPLVMQFLDCPLDPGLTDFVPEITVTDVVSMEQYRNLDFRQVEKSKWSMKRDPYDDNRRQEWANIKELAKKAVFKTAISSTAADMVKQYTDIEIDKVNWPGADMELMEESPKQMPRRRIGYIGSVRPHKCLEELLFGLTMLDEQPEFHAMTEDMGDYDKWSAMTACMMGATMSSWEGFGLSPVEWAAVKRPCICKSIPAVREIMSDHAFYVTGATELAAWVRQFLEHPDYAFKKGQEAYDYILERKLTLKDHAQRTIDILEEALH